MSLLLTIAALVEAMVRPSSAADDTRLKNVEFATAIRLPLHAAFSPSATAADAGDDPG